MTVSTESSQRSARLGLAQVCAAGVLWGTGGLVVTLLHDRAGLGAMTVSAWRMVLAAVALIGFAVPSGATCRERGQAKEDESALRG